eukprot:s83_g36.t1
MGHACGSGASAATLPDAGVETEGTGGSGGERVEPVTTSAQPGLKKDIQSKRILESQPTLHYEPPAKKKRTTASKAKPKNPNGGQETDQTNATKTPDSKELLKPTRATSPKIESTTPDSSTASAVQSSLNRASTFAEAEKEAVALSSTKLAILFDQWLTCEGHWRQSSLFLQLKTEKRFRKRGARKWLTQAELAMRYGSAEMAKKITQAKLDDPDMKDHDMRQFLVWTDDSEEDLEDAVTTSLFSADKKRKRKSGKQARKSKGKDDKSKKEDKPKKEDKDKGKGRKEETEEEKQKRENKEIEKKAKELIRKKCTTANKAGPELAMFTDPL